MQDIQITIIGNLTRDADLRYATTGDAIVQIQIAHTPRIQKNGQWTDGETTFLWATAWREMAEHIAETLHKGDRVIATGKLETERWADKATGELRETVKLRIEGIGPDLRFATATVKKASRTANTPAGAPDEYHAAVQTAREQLGAQPVSETPAC